MTAAQEQLFELPAQELEPTGAAGAVDLHGVAEELARALVAALRAGDALNAFLYAAGLSQLAEDRLEADVARLADVERVLAGSPLSRRAVPLAALARGLSATRRALRPSLRELARWERRLRALVDALADAVAAGTLTPARERELSDEAQTLCEHLPPAR